MNLSFHAVAPSPASEAAYTTMILGRVRAYDVLDVDLGRQAHERLKNLRMQVEWKEYDRGCH